MPRVHEDIEVEGVSRWGSFFPNEMVNGADDPGPTFWLDYQAMGQR